MSEDGLRDVELGGPAYETRFVPLSAADPDAVLRYIGASLTVVGHGGAVPINAGPGLRGIQLTLPIDLIHNVEAVIASYDRPELAAPPDILAVLTVSNATNVIKLLRELRLCPPDLDVTSVSENSVKVIVSGPASRRDFVSTVLKARIDKISSL